MYAFRLNRKLENFTFTIIRTNIITKLLGELSYYKYFNITQTTNQGGLNA
jgi:hypothetical protein